MVKCLICRKRYESVANGGKFTCNSCRDFLIAQGHYGAPTESIEEYTQRLAGVLDMPIGIHAVPLLVA